MEIFQFLRGQYHKELPTCMHEHAQEHTHKKDRQINIQTDWTDVPIKNDPLYVQYMCSE